MAPASTARILAASLILLAPPALARSKTPAAQPSPQKLAVKLSTSDPLNLFTDEDVASGKSVITVAVQAANLAAAPLRVQYHWKLENFDGHVARAGQLETRALAPGATDRWFVAFHGKKDLGAGRGYYRFLLRTDAAGEKNAWSTAFGVIPRPQPGLKPDSRFGVASSVDDQTFPALQRLGARWLRTESGCTWMACEPTAKGQFAWDAFDKLVAGAKAHDVMLLPMIGYAPNWARALGTDGKPVQYLDGPEKPEDFADFVSAVVARYGQDVGRFEVWNEPFVMGWTWHNTPAAFRDLLRAASAAAKKASPSVRLLASGASASHLRDVVFAKGAEATDAVDEVSFHAGTSGKPEDEFFSRAQYAAILAHQYGKGAPWDTEQGWQLWDSPAAARYVPRAYVLGALAGVRTLCWFNLTSDDVGLFKPGYEPRASAVSYAVCASLLEDAALVQDLYPTSRRLWGALFKNPEGHKVAVVWTTIGSGTLTLHNAAGVSALDLMGNPTGSRHGRDLDVPLSHSPVYLASDGDQPAFIQMLEAADVRNIPGASVLVSPFGAPIGTTPPIRVCVTDELNRPLSGTVEVEPPPGWRLENKRVPFGPVAPGRTLVVSVPVSQALVNPDNRYPVTAVVRPRDRWAGRDEWSVTRRQTLCVAAATHGSVTVDGDLSDWKGSLPIHADTADWVSPFAPEPYRKAWTPGNLSALVYTRWDDDNFYVAAQVQDNFQRAADPDADPYSLPFDGDCLQLAFGQDGWQEPGFPNPPDRRGVYRDTQNELDLFLSPKGPQVYRLQAPDSAAQTPYPTNPDLGLGPVADAKIAIKRDDLKETTVYECAIPWSDLRGLDRAKPFRFAFRLIDRDRVGQANGWLESGAGLGVTDGNLLSFSPSWTMTCANETEWPLLP